MEENKKQLIKRLCESWINSAYQTDGSIGIGVNTEKFRLLTNNIVFHELTYEETQAAYFGDIRTMIPELSGQHIGIIRTPYRNYPDTVSELSGHLVELTN